MPRIRSRLLNSDPLDYYVRCKAYYRTSPTGPVTDSGVLGVSGWTFPPSLKGRQVTVDENHGLLATQLRGSKTDVGGLFDSQTWSVSCNMAIQTLVSPWQSWWQGNQDWMRRYDVYAPVLAIDPSTLSLLDGSGLRSSNLGPKGTEAIAMCKPTNNVSNLANDLYEIRKGQLPRLPGRTLWKEKTNFLRSLGGEYLNKEFGWEPLVSDIRNASYAAANSNRLMKSYVENSGKLVRRRYEFPIEETTTTEDLGESNGFVSYVSISALAPQIGDGSRPLPHLHKTTTTTKSYWFAGGFTYWIPTLGLSKGLESIAEQASHLFGVDLTPTTLWKITPWTWAIDWFSNTGQIIDILSDMVVDGLVIKYGYIMEHVVQKVVYALDGPTQWKVNLPGTEFAIAAPVTVYYESKRREAATPFGFEASWEGMSLRQLAITAALGLTRLF